ncbi:unnamed protein product [Lampetra planeri]
MRVRTAAPGPMGAALGAPSSHGARVTQLFRGGSEDPRDLPPSRCQPMRQARHHHHVRHLSHASCTFLHEPDSRHSQKAAIAREQV